MKTATVAVKEEKIPTLSAVAPVHAQLIQELQESPGDSNMSKEIKSAICQGLRKRYLDEQREPLYMCTALNPEIQALVLPLRMNIRPSMIESSQTQGPFKVSYYVFNTAVAFYFHMMCLIKCSDSATIGETSF